MSDLVEFLLARITEDEMVARRATTSMLHGSAGLNDASGDWLAYATAGPGFPQRVLAECEAKRRIVDLHTPGRGPRHPVTDFSVYVCPLCGPQHHLDADPSFAPDEHLRECATLRLLALPYADHPDFDEAWRP